MVAAEEEIWKQVPGWEGIYDVSSLGRVRRVGAASGAVVGRILRPQFAGSRLERELTNASSSYMQVALSRGGKKVESLVHVLVLRAFVGECPPGHEADHIDGDRANNRLSNLRWVTKSRNNRRRALPPSHSKRKLSLEKAREIRKAVAGGRSKASLAAEYGCTRPNIHAVVSGRTWWDPDENEGAPTASSSAASHSQAKKSSGGRP